MAWRLAFNIARTFDNIDSETGCSVLLAVGSGVAARWGCGLLLRVSSFDEVRSKVVAGLQTLSVKSTSKGSILGESFSFDPAIHFLEISRRELLSLESLLDLSLDLLECLSFSDLESFCCFLLGDLDRDLLCFFLALGDFKRDLLFFDGDFK